MKTFTQLNESIGRKDYNPLVDAARSASRKAYSTGKKADHEAAADAFDRAAAQYRDNPYAKQQHDDLTTLAGHHRSVLAGKHPLYHLSEDVVGNVINLKLKQPPVAKKVDSNPEGVDNVEALNDCPFCKRLGKKHDVMNHVVAEGVLDSNGELILDEWTTTVGKQKTSVTTRIARHERLLQKANQKQDPNRARYHQEMIKRLRATHRLVEGVQEPLSNESRTLQRDDAISMVESTYLNGGDLSEAYESLLDGFSGEVRTFQPSEALAQGISGLEGMGLCKASSVVEAAAHLENGSMALTTEQRDHLFGLLNSLIGLVTGDPAAYRQVSSSINRKQ